MGNRKPPPHGNFHKVRCASGPYEYARRSSRKIICANRWFEGAEKLFTSIDHVAPDTAASARHRQLTAAARCCYFYGRARDLAWRGMSVRIGQQLRLQHVHLPVSKWVGGIFTSIRIADGKSSNALDRLCDIAWKVGSADGFAA